MAPRHEMRVTIDLRWMRPGHAGGIENLARSFLGELLALDRSNAYRVLLPAAVAHDFDTRHRDNFEIVAVDGPRQVWRRLSSRLGRRLGLATAEPDGPAPDVVLSLSGYIVPDMFRFRNVLVFTDLQHEFHPDFFSPGHLDERRRVYGTSLRKAAQVIAISWHTRQTVLQLYGLPPERVGVAHLAADPVFEPARWQPAELPRVMRKYGCEPGSYLLFPANTWPHKNHLRAFEALALLRDRHGRRETLVLTGAAKNAHDDLQQALARLGLVEQVRFLGYCPVEDLPALYRGARALFYPSLFEGFGIPVVEAMACGCPVVSSSATSLPEVVGQAGLLVDPLAPEQMAETLARLLGDPALQQELRERGSSRAAEFSWRRFTLEVLRALSAVAAPGGGEA